MASRSRKGPAEIAYRRPKLAGSLVSRLANRRLDHAFDSRFRQYLDALPEDIVIYQKHRIIYANQVAVRQLGAIDLMDLLGRRGLDFVAPLERQRLATGLRRLRELGSQSDLTRINRVGLDGRLSVVEALAVVILWEGQPAVLCTARDVTIATDKPPALPGDT